MDPTTVEATATAHRADANIILVIILCLGVATVAYTLGRQHQPTQNNIEYRFIPRTLEEEHELPSGAMQAYRQLAGEIENAPQIVDTQQK